MSKHELVCDWCGGEGEVLARDYSHMCTVKCTKCHHEWHEVIDLDEDIKDRLDIIGD
jgi:uncharacterized Zn finger protein